jgi:hydroxyethylthiazole kinase-like uncharacterized protein yjeF
MKIPVLCAEDIRAWDQYTISREPISSVDLMERAAGVCVRWLMQRMHRDREIFIFCGNGNNGGDGLAMARMLLVEKYKVKVFTASNGRRSADYQVMYDRLHAEAADCIHPIVSAEPFPANALLVDALIGTGLREQVNEEVREIIQRINQHPGQVIAIDIPSGLSADVFVPDTTAVRATYTLSFQCFKPAFLYPENGIYCGQIEVLDIGSAADFPAAAEATFQMSTREEMQRLFRPRNRYAHKGTFGHVLLHAGHYGMAGAALLSATGCLRAGAGLVTVLIADPEHRVIQAALPEAITRPYSEATVELPDWSRFAAIGTGCGIGQTAACQSILRRLLTESQLPLVIDADALTLLSGWEDGLSLIPRGSLLTPHPKEFDRLFGGSAHSMERKIKQKERAQQLGIYILLKGRYSVLATPEGRQWGNLSGGPGMAKAGSGDVLTGIISGLYAQYKNMETAARMGMWLHGRAGELAAERYGEESMLAGDISAQLGQAFQELYSPF